jgi:hypothetical protein
MKSITINKSINNFFTKNNKIILAIALVAIVLGLFFWLTYTNPRLDEFFISPAELKARSAAMPPASDKTCEKPGDIKFVGQNYSVCCPDGAKSPNCLCQLPNIKSCQQQFSDCLAGKVFSKSSRDFLGEENMPDTCQKLMDGCVSGSGSQTSSSRKPLSGMKPDLSSPSNSICSIDGYKKDNLASFCGNICTQIPECAYYQTDNISGSCGLFRGAPILLEKSAKSSSLGNYQVFSAKETESFSDILGPAGQFCQSGTIDKCSQTPGKSTDDCLCSHSVVKDCHKLYKKCLETNPANCRAQFGSCCGLIDTVKPSNNASMSSEAKIGSGRQTDILCSRPEINSLADCSAACLLLDTCDFINTNLQDISGDASSKQRVLTNDGLAPYCQLFKGKPLSTPGVMLGQRTGTGKTIYLKQRGNPDESDINA